MQNPPVVLAIGSLSPCWLENSFPRVQMSVSLSYSKILQSLDSWHRRAQAISKDVVLELSL